MEWIVDLDGFDEMWMLKNLFIVVVFDEVGCVM